ncbi:hypothetical protein [Maribacter arcticus]|uniref:hypothetical protein n=1 Tax=Maribacter arcticus TaxID=561365 RepID=UPI0030027E6B
MILNKVNTFFLASLITILSSCSTENSNELTELDSIKENISFTDNATLTKFGDKPIELNNNVVIDGMYDNQLLFLSFLDSDGLSRISIPYANADKNLKIFMSRSEDGIIIHMETLNSTKKHIISQLNLEDLQALAINPEFLKDSNITEKINMRNFDDFSKALLH